MAALEHLPDVTKLSDRVIRVLGQNPGKFTLQGTNVYLLGTSNPYILVDAGEGKDEFIPKLTSAFTSVASPTNTGLPDVSDVIISHWHHDHVGGLPSVLALLQKLWSARNPSAPFPAPRLHKFPLKTTSEATFSFNRLPEILSSLPKELYTPSPSGSILHDLHDSQVFQTASKDTTLRVLYTPGHTHDSICLHIPEERVLYTADTVLGQGTAVFENLALYLRSLNRMLTYEDFVSLLPSHGPVVKEGKDTIATYINHRLEREAQVLSLLSTRSPPPDANGAGVQWTTLGIVKDLYASYPENLWIPAMRGILLHLDKLEGEGKVKKIGVEGQDLQDAQWVVVSRSPSL
ncbi:lactamase [Ephemerocybe angulata]|uniref:Lactamase n=1 Tax=Ephemerocybe angulata TaxID=980116 RepID=A0A8H6IGP2_9AGAR|nr:lactamase [Tulosesus angulatus]